MPSRPTETAVLNIVGTAGKALAALLAAGAVAAAAGKGVLAAVLIVLGALGGALGVVADARIKVLERRQAHPSEQSLGRPRHEFLGAAPRRAPRYVPRVELEQLVDALLQAQGRPVALVGMGGVGKTVLAIEAVHHKQIRRRFRDGVAWLTVEPRANALALQTDLARRLAGGRPVFRSVSDGRGALAELGRGRIVLVVLDNVWERDVLDAFPPNFQILFTSRSISLARNLNAMSLEVSDLEPEQALQLLANWTSRTRVELDHLPAEAMCRRLEWSALGVAMIGAMIGSGGDERRWHDVLARVEAADLAHIQADFGDDYPHPTLLAAIELGIAELPDDHIRARYCELAVFNGRGGFPRAAAEALWRPVGLSGPDTGDLLALLEGRSLIHPESERWYRLHDLQADVVANQLGTQGLIDAHAQLLGGYRRRAPANWYSLPDDGYILDNLAYHLTRIGHTEELRSLLVDLRWLHTRLTSTGPTGLLADYAHLPDDPEVRALQAVLRLSGETLARDPAQLPGQLIGRLGNVSGSALDRLLDQAAMWSGEAWLCPSVGALTSPYGRVESILHRARVHAVVLTINGRLVSGGEDGVRVWELDSGRELGRAHSNPTEGLAVTADGWVASGGPSGRLRVWELDSGRELLRGETGWIRAVAFSSDGRALSGGNTGVHVWDVARGQELRRFKAHTGWVSALVVTRDGRVVSGGDDGIRVWELDSGRELGRFDGHTSPVSAVFLTGDGRVISAAVHDGVRVWELGTGRELRAFLRQWGVSSLAATTDGRVLSGGYDGVRVWELETGRELRQVDSGGSCSALAITTDGRVVSGGSGGVQVWELDGAQQLPDVERHHDWIRALAVTPDRRVVAGGLGGTVRVYDPKSGRELRRFEGHTADVWSVAVTTDGRVVSGGDDGVRVWELDSGREVRRLSHSYGMRKLAISGDGLVVAIGQDSEVVLELDTGRELRRFDRPTGLVFSVALSTDDRVVCGGYNGIRVWELDSGRELRGFQGHKWRVFSVAVSTDGLVVSGGDDGVLVWELETGREVRRFGGHSDLVSSVALTSDRRVVSASGWAVCVWELDTGRDLVRWTGDAEIRDCAVPADSPLTVAVGDARGIPYTLRLRGAPEAQTNAATSP